jgi:hypothetical protein
VSGEGELGADISGLWHGRFSYPAGARPTAFIAILNEIDGWISGSTEELPGGVSSVTLTATLQGRRSASEVTFLKTYDQELDHYDAVSYAGVLNADATEITGRWTIPGSWSGDFLMVRASGPGAAAAISRAEAV